jgi:hypothetical protein
VRCDRQPLRPEREADRQFRRAGNPTRDVRSIRNVDRGLRGPSRTALMAAMGRALHREGPLPHIFDDWLAADLAGEGGRAIVAGMRERSTPERM